MLQRGCSHVKNLLTTLTLSTTYVTMLSQHIGRKFYGTNECPSWETDAPAQPMLHSKLGAIFNTMALIGNHP